MYKLYFCKRCQEIFNIQVKVVELESWAFMGKECKPNIATINNKYIFKQNPDGDWTLNLPTELMTTANNDNSKN